MRAAVLAPAALPWAWFLLRDALGVVGDVIAILLPLLVLPAVVLALRAARNSRLWLLTAASVLVMGVVSVVGPWLPADAGPVVGGMGVRVAGANVQGSDASVQALFAASPDVLVTPESTQGLAAELSAVYPYQHFAAADGPAVGIYSRFPLRVLQDAGPDLPGARVEVDGPAGTFVLYALHVPRPWFTSRGSYQATVAEHHAIMVSLAARMAAETLPVVVVGDLNSPDRGRDYRLMLDRAGLVDAMRAGPTTFSSVGQWTPLLLRIDHLMISRGWCGDDAAQLSLVRSDHRGVAATIGPCAGPPVGSPS